MNGIIKIIIFLVFTYVLPRILIRLYKYKSTRSFYIFSSSIVTSFYMMILVFIFVKTDLYTTALFVFVLSFIGSLFLHYVSYPIIKKILDNSNTLFIKKKQ